MTYEKYAEVQHRLTKEQRNNEYKHFRDRLTAELEQLELNRIAIDGWKNKCKYLTERINQLNGVKYMNDDESSQELRSGIQEYIKLIDNAKTLLEFNSFNGYYVFLLSELTKYKTRYIQLKSYSNMRYKQVMRSESL